MPDPNDEFLIHKLLQQTKLVEDDIVIKNNDYPCSLEEFIGQKDAISRLNIHIKAAQIKGNVLGHTIIYGPAGLGKTRIANLISRKFKGQFHQTSGRLLRSLSQLEEIFQLMNFGDILFIDEIHGLNKKISDTLLPVLQDSIFGDLEIPKFTCIGASTSIGKLSKPMRDRFKFLFELDYYDNDEMSEIINNYAARKYAVDINEKAGREISKRSHGIPRLANRLVDTIKDFSIVLNDGAFAEITEDLAEHTFKALDIDHMGLEKTHRKIIKYLFQQTKPVGKETICVALSIDPLDLEELYEGTLIRTGLVVKTPKGRELSNDGRKYAMEINKPK